MAAAQPVDVAQELSDRVGSFGPDEEWVKQTLALFPIARIEDASPLFSALRRVLKSVPWLADAFGDIDVAARLDRVKAKLEPLGAISRQTARRRLRGDGSWKHPP